MRLIITAEQKEKPHTHTHKLLYENSNHAHDCCIPFSLHSFGFAFDLYKNDPIEIGTWVFYAMPSGAIECLHVCERSMAWHRKCTPHFSSGSDCASRARNETKREVENRKSKYAKKNAWPIILLLYLSKKHTFASIPHQKIIINKNCD